MNSVSIAGVSLLMSILAVSAQVNFIIGNTEYFTDVTSKINREAAIKLCNDQRAELAKITDLTLYYQVMINLADADPNIYWIDGIYNISNPDEFKLNDDCTSGYLNLEGVPYEDVINLCLAIERGENARSHKIRSLTCTLQQFVLCSKPLNSDCGPIYTDPPPSPSTDPPPSPSTDPPPSNIQI